MPIVNALTLDGYEKFIRPEKRELFINRLGEFKASNIFERKYKFNLNQDKSYRSATLPYPELLKQSSGIGSVQESPDSDGVFRRHYPFNSFDGFVVPSLPFALYSLTDTLLVNQGDEKIDLTKFQDFDNKLIINLHGKNLAYESFSLASIIQSQAEILEGKSPSIPLETFKDKWVFVGCTAPGLLDFRPTSLEERGHGVSFIASVFDNILNQNFIRVTTRRVSFLITAFLIVLALSITYSTNSLQKQIFAFAILVFGYIGFAQLAAEFNFWIPLILPLSLLFSIILVGLTLEYQVEGKQHKFLKNAFQHYVSPSLVSQIVLNPQSLSLGGEKREVSIFFSDIAGFTSVSEKLDPTILVTLLNEYLSLFTETIQELNGTVDKYVGDAVVAFWNAPVEISNHADLALRSAINCQKKLLEKHDYFMSKFGVFPATRIGINTAVVTVGNFGSKNRFDYTIIGDGANFASRLEGANKIFGTSILFSETNREKLTEDFKFRPVGNIKVLGKEQSVRIFEPIYSESQLVFSKDKLEIYQNGLSAFENGDLQLAKENLKKLSSDPLSLAYLNRIDDYILTKNLAYSHTWELEQK